MQAPLLVLLAGCLQRGHWPNCCGSFDLLKALPLLHAAACLLQLSSFAWTGASAQEAFVLLSLSSQGFYSVIGLEALGLSLESRVSARPVRHTLHVNESVSLIVSSVNRRVT